MEEKVYISGKITGLEIDEAKYHFSTIAIQLKVSGYIPVNPFNIEPLFGIKMYWFFMMADVIELVQCDSIFMLKNWQDSRGAKMEHFIAKLLKLKIYYE